MANIILVVFFIQRSLDCVSSTPTVYPMTDCKQKVSWGGTFSWYEQSSITSLTVNKSLHLTQNQIGKTLRQGCALLRIPALNAEVKKSN